MAPTTNERAVRCRVLFDMVTWSTRVPDTNPAQYTHNRAYKGAEVEMPQSEFDRVSGLGGVAKLQDAVAAAAELEAATEAMPAGEAGDLELATYSAADLIAYVTQHPEERLRVYGIESQRSKPRATVMSATEINDLDAEAARRAAHEPPGV